MKRLNVVLLLATASTAGASPLSPRDDTRAPVARSPAAAALSQPAQPSSPGTVAPSPPAASRDPDELESTWLLQTVLGSMAGAAAGWGGGYLGYQIECRRRHCQDFDGVRGLLLGGSIGLTAATTAVVFAIGGDRDHEGSITMTWIGTLVGGTVGVLGASQVVDSGLVPATVIVATSTALGGTLMFRATRTRKRPATALRLLPFSDGSSIIGLSLGNAF